MLHLNSGRKRTKRMVKASLKGRRNGRPRLTVFRSNKQVYAQIIDDTKNVTLASVDSHKCEGNNKTDIAKNVGKTIAEMAVKLKIKEVVFDRNGYLYHGRVKALADGAREGGLEF